MEGIPSSWPPPEEPEAEPRVYPLFLLQHVWLFPYAILPLHVFEPRYRQMVEDCLDGPGRIVLATAHEGHDMSGSPPFYPVAGLGEIGRHDRHPDGRYSIVLVGLRRILGSEVESDRLYRKVEAQPAVEVPVPREREPELRAELQRAIVERTSEELAIPPHVPTASLADLLLLRMRLPFETMVELYSELDAEKRARGALAQHAIRPKPADEGQA